jgi:hypothetical protein
VAGQDDEPEYIVLDVVDLAVDVGHHLLLSPAGMFELLDLAAEVVGSPEVIDGAPLRDGVRAKYRSGRGGDQLAGWMAGPESLQGAGVRLAIFLRCTTVRPWCAASRFRRGVGDGRATKRLGAAGMGDRVAFGVAGELMALLSQEDLCHGGGLGHGVLLVVYGGRSG